MWNNFALLCVCFPGAVSSVESVRCETTLQYLVFVFWSSKQYWRCWTWNNFALLCVCFSGAINCTESVGRETTLPYFVFVFQDRLCAQLVAFKLLLDLFQLLLVVLAHGAVTVARLVAFEQTWQTNNANCNTGCGTTLSLLAFLRESMTWSLWTGADIVRGAMNLHAQRTTKMHAKCLVWMYARCWTWMNFNTQFKHLSQTDTNFCFTSKEGKGERKEEEIPTSFEWSCKNEMIYFSA